MALDDVGGSGAAESPWSRVALVRPPQMADPLREFAASFLLDGLQSAERRRIADVMVRRACPKQGTIPRPAIRAEAHSWAPAFRGPLGETEDAFDEQMNALHPGRETDLRAFHFRQSLVEHQWQEPATRRVLLRRLHESSLVRPARHFCYETARQDAQYGDRLGFPFADLVRFCGRQARGEILLELGQGSGACLAGRRSYARNFLQVGCCDALRYNLRDLLLHALDRECLARGIGRTLGRPEWQAAPGFWRRLSTFVAKVLLIRPEYAGEAEVPFDEEALAALAADPNALRSLFAAKASLLTTTKVVPADEGAPHPERESDFLYPHLFPMPNDADFRAACELLAADPVRHLLVGLGKLDALDVLPVYPCGTLLGDFRDLVRGLSPGQVSLAVGIRSTQALEGEDYVAFMVGMTRLLAQGKSDERHGIYVDDNARQNYGRYYPLEELREAERRAGFPFFVVRGHGPEPWEEDVSVAVVATRSAAKLRFVARSLRPGFRLQRPGDLLDDRDFRKRLPPRPSRHSR